MNEFLAYRLPKNPIVKQSGSWSKVDLYSLSNAEESFIFSDFESENAYLFTVNTTEIDTHVTPKDKVLKNSLSQEEYIRTLGELKSIMKKNGVEKTVFSRIKSMHFPSDKLWKVFDTLEKSYPDAFVYFLHSEEFGTWMGATPETLLELTTAETYKTMALAGTLSMESNEKWGEKEINEHLYVADYIQETIEKYGKLLHVSPQEEKVAGEVKHLCTRFEFDLEEDKRVPFITELHPTPAVCGTPSDAALNLIHSFEGYCRSLYCGFIGILGSKTTNLFVNLRCMQCYKDEVDMYLGGGITLASVPEKEWEETENKALTLQQILRQVYA